MREILPGCGVDFVGWHSAHIIPRSSGPEGTPIGVMRGLRDQLKSGGKMSREERVVCLRMTRAIRCLSRNRIFTWKKLQSISEVGFRTWEGYGALTHQEVVDMAAMCGVKIPTWTKKWGR